jgi:anthranilate synthase component 2
MKLLMIDNYDSFTYNLVQYFLELGVEVITKRNNEITLREIVVLQPDYLVISPGPGIPKQAGISMELIRYFSTKLPILGICLGHQAIGEVFGSQTIRAQEPIHGKISLIHNDQQGLFTKLPKRFSVTRYHSLIIKNQSLPDCLRVSAWTQDGNIMGIRHKTLAIEGVQFHPESIMSEYGHMMLKNFLQPLRY